VGLFAKTALFPLYLWLPAAHAGAPAAASAVLSALVVKGSFFITVRLWFFMMPGLAGVAAPQLLGALGAGAIVFGSLLALRQQRLKLMVAYSTVAQIGYLFLMFPLAFNAATGQLESGGALAGGLLQTISHATAKAAMFMSAGLIYAALGHDRIAGLAGIARAMPMSVIAFALAGAALIGVPPSGAYLAKELLLQAASGTGQWWWAVAIQAGGILTSSYVVLVLAHALAPADEPVTPRARIARMGEAAALAVALCSLLLGLVPWQAYLPIPQGAVPTSMGLQVLWSSLWPLFAGVVLAILLGRWDDRFARISLGKAADATVSAARCATLGFSNGVERIDGVLRQWPAAGLCMLVLAIAFAAAMLAGR
jgi:formate hydrogenlyase subunit 3/multisubunit Na+/H+ antiporter MnhD subunit